nr:tryptophan 2-monooxygenase [Ipomoea batatas]
MDVPYSRPRFAPFAISSLIDRRVLKTAVPKAFAAYDQFCTKIMHQQQDWIHAVCSRGRAEPVPDIEPVLQIAPCLHGPGFTQLEVLRSDSPPAFIYTSLDRWLRLVSNECIAWEGEPVVACALPPYAQNVSLQDLVQAHNKVCPDTYKTISDVEYFIAIQPSNLFEETGAHVLRSGRSCRFFRRPPRQFCKYDIVTLGPVIFHDEQQPTPLAYIKPAGTCYNYQIFLEETTASGAFGHYPEGVEPPRVAIFGGALSGLVTALELVSAGVKKITLFERVDELLKSYPAPPPHSSVLQSVPQYGVMPLSGNQICLSHYLDKYRIQSSLRFPRVGTDLTALYFRKNHYTWRSGQAPPDVFGRVCAGWSSLLDGGCEFQSAKLVSLLKINFLLSNGQRSEAALARATWLSRFKDSTFHAALVEIFSRNVSPPGGEAWQEPEDFEAFGMFRLGCGRVSSLYHAVKFSVVLDWIIFGYEDNRHLSVGGARLLQARMRMEIAQANRGDELLCAGAIQKFAREGKVFKAILQDKRSLVFDKILHCGDVNIPCGDEEAVESSVQPGYEVSISALFMVTTQKFWLHTDIPVIVWTDGLIRELYCLDIELETGEGLVVIQYDADEFANRVAITSDNKSKCAELIREISGIHAELASHLVPVNEDYVNYVFHGHVVDPFCEGDLGVNDASFGPNVREAYKVLLKEDDDVYFIRHPSVTEGSVEEHLQAGINAACTVIRRTGGVLNCFNPLGA